ncbi:MAG: beta-propeller fold lactonase family protein [Bryobacterales bacterium]|nr:beta-propeller fold lactonase family protein [Bryobacterales bacterium]
MWLFLLIASSLACAAEIPNMVVVEKKAGAAGFYDASGKRVAGVKVGTHPHEIVFSADRKLAYISDNGILWMQYAGEGGNTISIIDLAGRKKAGVIDLGANRRPHGMDLDAKTNRLVCTTENPDGLLLIDLTTRQILRRYDVKGEDPHMVLFGPDGKWAYVSNSTSNTIAAVHLESGNVKLIPTDARPQGGVLSNDRKTIYITNSNGNSISIIDPAKNERTGTIATGKGPARIVMTPDSKTLIYNLQAGQAVAFADVSTRKETKVIPLGGDPLSLTMTPDGQYAFAGVQDQDKIFVISVPERKIVKVIQTPKEAGPDPVMPLP